MTVLQRLNHLCLMADKKQRTAIGELVAARFKQSEGTRVKTAEAHDGFVFDVWDYPESFHVEMDIIIRQYLRPRRKRIQVGSIKIA